LPRKDLLLKKISFSFRAKRNWKHLKS